MWKDFLQDLNGAEEYFVGDIIYRVDNVLFTRESKARDCFDDKKEVGILKDNCIRIIQTKNLSQDRLKLLKQWGSCPV